MPGESQSRWASAWSASASCRSPTASASWVQASLRYSRRSLAIWSLRDRPARSLPPTAPRCSTSHRSIAPWTSSSSGSKGNSPAANSVAHSSIPRRRVAASSGSSTPMRCSSRTCARDPARSWRQSATSKDVDTPSCQAASSGPCSNRPPHRRPVEVASDDIVTAPGCRRGRGRARPTSSAAGPTASRSPRPASGRTGRPCRRSRARSCRGWTSRCGAPSRWRGP